MPIEAVYRERFRDFLRVAIAIVGEYEAALDAVQDGFGDAIRGRAGYRGTGPIDAWIWRAVVNASRDVRKARSHTVAPAFAPADPSNGRAEVLPELRAAVAALPERQRLVLFLRYYADLDYRTIASALGISDRHRLGDTERRTPLPASDAR